MERHKYRTNIVKKAEPKKALAYVDTGETRNLFHSKSVFMTNIPIKQEVAESARTTSSLVGKGTVEIKIDGGIVLEA